MGRHAGELVAPQLPVGAVHSLLVVGGYVAAVTAAAVVVAWRRDVIE